MGALGVTFGSRSAPLSDRDPSLFQKTIEGGLVHAEFGGQRGGALSTCVTPANLCFDLSRDTSRTHAASRIVRLRRSKSSVRRPTGPWRFFKISRSIRRLSSVSR